MAVENIPPSNSPLRVQQPPDLVGVTCVQNHVADKDGGLARTGAIEIRFTRTPTKGSRKDVDWHKTAYNVGHQLAFAQQSLQDQAIRHEELERRYTAAAQNSEAYQRDMTRLRPVINAAFNLKTWWGFFLLPKSFRRLVSSVER